MVTWCRVREPARLYQLVVIVMTLLSADCGVGGHVSCDLLMESLYFFNHQTTFSRIKT